MKKLLTAIALAASVMTVSAQDVITPAALLTQNPSASTSPDNAWGESDYTMNSELTYVGESGAKYSLYNVGLTNAQMYFAYGSHGVYCVQSEDKWVESIEFTIAGWVGSSETYGLYGSEEPFEYSDRYSASYAESISAQNSNKVTFNVPVKYFYLVKDQSAITRIKVNWTTEKPVPTVEKPVISYSGGGDPEVGGNVTIKTTTLGATIHTSVYVNDVLAEEQPTDFVQQYEWESKSITLPGKAGDKVSVEAYATKDGWVESEKATWECAELAMAPAPTPTVTKVGSDSRWINYLIAGEQLQIAVNTNNTSGETTPLEGATVTYNYGWNDYDSGQNFVSETKTEAAPVILTIPDDVPVGAYFYVEGVANADGYKASETFNEGSTIISNLLNAPTFDPSENGAMIKAGKSLVIYRPQYATEINYQINDGDINVSTDYSVSIEVIEEITVRAWATGNAPFQPSEVAVITVVPEKIEDWEDAITYATFGISDNFSDTKFTTYDSTVVNSHLGVNYEYRGGFHTPWDNSTYEYVEAFYMSGNYSDYPLLRNTNSAVGESKEEAPVNTIQIDGMNNASYFLFLSNEPITAISSAMSYYEYTDTNPLRITVANSGSTGSTYSDNFGCETGQKIDLDAIQEQYGDATKVYNDKLYFAVAPVQPGQNNYTQRVIVGYDNAVLTGVKGIAADALEGVDAIFNLNGVKVNADNLTPGIYVRIANGKSSKIVVK